MNSFFVNLNDLDLIAVTGTDSKKFLQGQLTCDVETLVSQQHCFGAICNNKGRVLANFILVNINDTYYFELPAKVSSIISPILEKYKVFYQCAIDSNNSDLHRYGLVGEKSKQFLEKIFPELPTESGKIAHHNGLFLFCSAHHSNRYELWVPTEANDMLKESLQQNISQEPLSKWQLLDIQSGLFFVTPEESGLHTPQELNLDLSGFINFQKGCYTGQEIVARMHYRGKSKKRLHRLLIESKGTLSRGDEISLNSKTYQLIILEPLEADSTDNNEYEALIIASDIVEKENVTEGLLITPIALEYDTHS